MGKATVLSHVFQHDGEWHFFDAVTNQLYECDEVVAAAIPALNDLDDPAVRSALEDRWGKGKLDNALREIEELREGTQALTPRALKIVDRCACCYAAQSYEDSIGHLTLTITEQCNLRCRYCPYTTGRIGARVHNDARMTGDILRAAIDFFMARNAKREKPIISFYGGEPLLAFDLLMEGIAHIRAVQGERNVQIHIDTNGTLINEEIARLLIDEECFLQISLDGPKILHDRYRVCREGLGTHDRIIEGLRTLLRLDPGVQERLRFNAVMAPPFALKMVADYFSDFPVYREFGITRQPKVSIDFADLALVDFKTAECAGFEETDPREDIKELHDQYLAACRNREHSRLAPAVRGFFDGEIIKFHHRPRTLQADEVFPTGCCQPGQRKIHVRADGSLLPCERGSDSMFIGHVDTGIDMEMIHTLYKKLGGAVADRCRTCWAIRCCSLCFIQMNATWQADGKGVIEIPEEFCEGIRRNAEVIFSYYMSLQKLGPHASEWLKDTVLE